MMKSQTTVKGAPMTYHYLHDFDIDFEIITTIERCFLDKTHPHNNPLAIAETIAHRYNVPMEHLQDILQQLETLYQTFRDTMELDESIMNNLFYVESPADHSLAQSIHQAHVFTNMESAPEEDPKTCIIALITDTSLSQLNAYKEPDELLRFIESLSCSVYQKWNCTRIVFNFEDVMDEYENTLEQLRPLYESLQSKHVAPSPFQSLNIEKTEVLGHYLETAHTIIMPSQASFNGLRVFSLDDETVLVYAGILYETFTNLIHQHSQNDDVIVNRLKAIGDLRRLEIIKALQVQPLCGKDIAKMLSLTSATVSHHMNSLVNEELVRIKKHGARIEYSLNYRETQRLLSSLTYILTPPESSDKTADELQSLDL